MQAIIHSHSLHSFFDALMNSPHHLMAWVAVAAALLVCIPLMRLIFRSSGGDSKNASSLSVGAPSMLGLSSPSSGFQFAPIDHVAPLSNVTAINEALTVPCIHCGVTMSTRQDFCPACGYAQPAKQTFTAAFPA